MFKSVLTCFTPQFSVCQVTYLQRSDVAHDLHNGLWKRPMHEGKRIWQRREVCFQISPNSNAWHVCSAPCTHRQKRKKLKIIRSQVRHFDPFHRYGFFTCTKKCICVVALYICYASNVCIYIYTYLYVFKLEFVKYIRVFLASTNKLVLSFFA